MDYSPISPPCENGGRFVAPKYRQYLPETSEECGLQDDIRRYDLLKAVKKAGKDAGFKPELVELLEYYVVRTQDVDWTCGARPIMYQSVISTAQDLDISERQVRNREKALHALGALSWYDSGNFKRYGMRDRETGAILYAFGVDLSPLAALLPHLEEKIAQKQEHKKKWHDTKRRISAYRAQIRIAIAGLQDTDMAANFQARYDAIAHTIRTYHSLDALQQLRDAHKALYDSVTAVLVASQTAEKADNISPTDVIDCPHIQSTNNKISNKLDYSNRADRGDQVKQKDNILKPSRPQRQTPLPTHKTAGNSHVTEDISNITWKQVINACSDRYKAHIPLHNRPLSWGDLTEAAHALLPLLNINQSAWWQACSVLGRTGATICVMIIDQKAQDPDNPIRNAGGYLRVMTQRATQGNLNLQGSIFGLLKRDIDNIAV